MTGGTRWECVGPVRGRCGVRHRSLDAAWRHCHADHRAVLRGHGPGHYSDRRPVALPGPDGDQETTERPTRDQLTALRAEAGPLDTMTR